MLKNQNIKVGYLNNVWCLTTATKMFLFDVKNVFYILRALFLVCLFYSSIDNAQAIKKTNPHITLWHSFSESTAEYNTFSNAISQFKQNNPNIKVTSVSVPYAQLVNKFITASQGGEAPDVIRLTSQEIAKIGQVNISGLPLLESLDSHFTPIEKRIYQPSALLAMKFEDRLYALPASQSALSLLYNKDLFDQQNLPYPNENWNINDLLTSAKQLTKGETYGLALPSSVFLWWVPFQLGFNGDIFDINGEPAFSSKASVEATQWLFDLESKHKVIAPGKANNIENVKNGFLQSKAAMIVDGSWNWTTYTKSGMNVGQVTLPYVSSTKRITPLLYYLGWAVSKSSPNKIEAASLVQWLSSKNVQKEFALRAFTLPTIKSLKHDKQLNQLSAFEGFMQQIESGFPAPTNKAMPLMIKPIETAIELSLTEQLDMAEAFHQAELELKQLLKD